MGKRTNSGIFALVSSGFFFVPLFGAHNESALCHTILPSIITGGGVTKKMAVHTSHGSGAEKTGSLPTRRWAGRGGCTERILGVMTNVGPRVNEKQEGSNGVV